MPPPRKHAMNMRFSSDELAQLGELAADRGVSKADIIRMAIGEYAALRERSASTDDPEAVRRLIEAVFGSRIRRSGGEM